MIEPITRRTFFFLGLGLMGGKILYPYHSIIKPTLDETLYLNMRRIQETNIIIGGVWNQPYLEYYRILAKNEIWDPNELNILNNNLVRKL